MPIASNFPDVELPVTDLWPFLFDRKDRTFPDSQDIYQDADDLNRRYTYADLRQLSIDFGRGLRSNYGFHESDVLALYVPNDIDVGPLILGTLWVGGTVSPANPTYTVPELVYQLKDSGAKLLVTHESCVVAAREACQTTGIPETNIILLGKHCDPRGRLKHWKSVCDHGTKMLPRTSKISPKHSLAFLVYSSGTTGRPKGVRLTHYNMTSNIKQVQSTEGSLTWNGAKTVPGIPDAPRGQGDRILACLPLFHIYGLNLLVLFPLYSGVHTLVLTRFELENWCRLVQDHKVTFSYIVPPIVLLLCKDPIVDKYDLRSLRMTNSGAAPLTRDLVEALFKRTGVRVKQAYGLTETSPAIFMQRWEDWQSAVGTTGWLMPNCLVKFCEIAGPGEDPDFDKELPRGQTGELYVKGPNIFHGYLNNPSASAECLKDGWFRTGDVGFFDVKGNLTITDRVKELIKYKGFQVAPAELEGYLTSHELVDDVAVVGVNSTILATELPRACVVRKGGMGAVQTQDGEDIIGWLNNQVASHKRLRGGVQFVDMIPKSVSGKILRRLLKDQAQKEFETEEEASTRARKVQGAKL